MPNMGRGAGLSRPETNNDIGDASVTSTGKPSTVSAVAASPTSHPLELAMIAEDSQHAVKATTTIHSSSTSNSMGTQPDGGVSPIRDINNRCSTTRNDEGAGVSNTSTKKFSVGHSFGGEEAKLSSLARSRTTMNQGPGNGKRLLSRVGTRLCKGDDGGVATEGIPLQRQKTLGCEGEPESHTEDENERFAYEDVQLFWTLDGGPNGGRERESAQDMELGLSAPRLSFQRQPSLSIDKAGGISKDMQGMEGSTAASGSGSLDATVDSSFGTWPARGTSEYMAKVTTHAKQALNDAINDERLKRRNRSEAKKVARAAQERANAATNRCDELRKMVETSLELSVGPAVTELGKLRKAWSEKRNHTPIVEEKARIAAANLAEAQGALLAANGKLEAARGAQDAIIVSFLPGPAPLDFDTLRTVEDSARRVLANAQTAAKRARAWVQIASAAAVEASNVVDAGAAERLAFAHEFSRSTIAYRTALTTYQELEVELESATDVEQTATKEAKHAKVQLVGPFQDHIAAKNRTERNRETYEMLLGRGGNKSSRNGRSDVPSGGGGCDQSQSEGQVAGTKRRGTATMGGDLDAESDDDMMVETTFGKSDKDCKNKDRAPKRRRYLEALFFLDAKNTDVRWPACFANRQEAHR